MYRIILLLFISFLFAGCKEKIIQIPVEVEAMRASNLYIPDSVSAFISDLTERQKEVASDYLKRSIDIETKDFKKSIYLQKRALSLNPEHEGYKRLGQLFKKHGNYSEAHELYSFLMQRTYENKSNVSDTGRYLFSKPDADDYYNYISTQIASSQYFDMYLVYDAKENGIDIQYLRKKLFEDEHLGIEKNSLKFKNILVNFWTEHEIEEYKRSKEAFSVYIGSAKDSVSGFTISAANVSDFDFLSNLSFPDEEMVLSDFNKYFLEESQKEDFYGFYNLNNCFRFDKETYVMIYALDSSASGCIKELRNITHKLAVYDKTGKIINTLIIARQSPHELITAEVTFPLIRLKYFKRNWKNPINDMELENEIESTELLKEEVFRYAEGTFVPENVF